LIVQVDKNLFLLYMDFLLDIILFSRPDIKRIIKSN